MKKGYMLYWREWKRGCKMWFYGGIYDTKEQALSQAKKELTGAFDYQIEAPDGSIAEQGSAVGKRGISCQE